MQLLLDTHIWVWLAQSPQRLGKKTARLLLDPANTTLLSPISIWEFATLVERRRFKGINDAFGWIAAAMREWPMIEAPLNNLIAIDAAGLRFATRDPSDYLIVATARVNQMTLITHDAAIIASGLVATIPND